MCDRKIPVKLKVKLYRSVVRPAMLYGAQCRTVKRKEEQLILRTEMKMLRWLLGISLKYKIRSEEVRQRAGVVDILEKQTEARLGWYGHVKRKADKDAVR